MHGAILGKQQVYHKIIVKDSPRSGAGAGYSEASEPLLGGGWMGSLTNLLLKTLLDVSVTVSNTVVKLRTPHAAANLTSQYIQMSTAAGDWKADLQVILRSSSFSSLC